MNLFFVLYTMAHHEKLPTPITNRSQNKLQVNGTGNANDLLISFNHSTGWYASGSDVVFSSNGIDRVIYGVDHTAYQRPILINDFDRPPEILGGGLLFKRPNDATLWWRTPEHGDQPVINYPPDSAPVYKKFNTPGLFYIIDGVECSAQQDLATNSPSGAPQPQVFPLVDTQPRDAAAPSFAVGDSGMFLDSNGNLSFSVNKMLNTTMQPDGTIITDGYLFMDGHSLRSTPTELILTAGTHPVKINNGAIVARSMQSQTMQADAIKTAVLSTRVIAGKSGVVLTLGDKITCHAEMTFDTMPSVTHNGQSAELSIYTPSLKLPCEPLLAGDFVCVNERGARRYTGGLVRNIDTFLLADYIFFKSSTEMLSVAGGHITHTTGGEQVNQPGAAIHAELYHHNGHLYRVSNVLDTQVAALPGIPQACAVDQDAVLLIADGTLYIYNGGQMVSSKIPLEADEWQILILPGYTGVISGSYFKIVFLYSGKITWGVPYADYQCTGCISMTYNGKYNVLVSLEKTFLSDSYLQVLDITGLIINKVITRSAFSGALDMAYNAATDSYCLVVHQDDQVLFKPFYYDGRDITFALTYIDRKIKTVMSRITPAEDYFIFAYADDCLLISAFYDQRADIVGMALTDSINGQCTVQTIGSVVQLPGELPARYVGKKIHLCNARPYPDNLKLSGGIPIGVCLNMCHLKI